MIVAGLLAAALALASKQEVSAASVSGIVEEVSMLENGYCTLSVEAKAGAPLPVLARLGQCSVSVGNRVYIRAAIEAAVFRVGDKVSPRFWLRAVTLEVLPP